MLSKITCFLHTPWGAESPSFDKALAFLFFSWPMWEIEKSFLLCHKFLSLLNQPEKWIFLMLFLDWTWSMVILESLKIWRFWIPRKSEKEMRPTRDIISALLLVLGPPFQCNSKAYSSWVIIYTFHAHILFWATPSKYAGDIHRLLLHVDSFLERPWVADGDQGIGRGHHINKEEIQIHSYMVPFFIQR